MILDIVPIITCIALVVHITFPIIINFARSHSDSFFFYTEAKTSSHDQSLTNTNSFSNNNFFSNTNFFSNNQFSNNDNFFINRKPFITNENTFTSNGKTFTRSSTNPKNSHIKGEGCEQICSPDRMGMKMGRMGNKMGRMEKKMGRTGRKTHCFLRDGGEKGKFEEHVGKIWREAK
ncbi:hypothetical protein CKM354_000004000 [Cercospora kikuchii]|uniref:Uncharacterized protein n=1 Tax=Cercospora kikuchii TaxID=84275 RepID=A0A9P3FB77_9PEZI|nr:uncharacterized protein CKM354_000004000 [Cercospora kikuchii]GIZ36569.1 hypothetical protein CKM354_000004000 [Cercospora kikuchii]